AEGGLFLGDYQALASIGENFVPFFVQTTGDGPANRTDVFAGVSLSVIPTADVKAKTGVSFGERIVRARASPLPMTPEVAQRMHENVLRVLQRRLPSEALQVPPKR